jgi:drug/metabolite transporter (DMT)-like permease
MNRNAPLAYALLCIATLAWAGNFIVGRYIHTQVTPVTLSYGRWGLALLILLPFTLRAVLRQLPLVRQHLLLFAALGLTGMTLFHSFVYAALEATGAINAALILSITPVVIVALSWLLDREPISPFQAAGIAVSLVGAVVLITRGDLGAVRTLDFNRGDLWMLIAMPNWALYSVLLRRRPHDVAPMVVLTVTIAAGLAFLTPVFIFELVRGTDFQVNAETLLSVAYVLFASVIAYVCWNRGVALIGANRAGLFMHLVPVFSALLAIAVLGESLEAHHGFGIALIVAGIYLTTSMRSFRSRSIHPPNTPLQPDGQPLSKHPENPQ